MVLYSSNILALKSKIYTMKFNVIVLSLLTIVITSCQKTQPVKNQFNENTELEAIESVIANETKCFFDGDYDCWASNWSHEPYTMQAWNNDDNTFSAAIGWDSINAQGKYWIEKYYKNGENIIHPLVKKDKPIVNFFNDSTAYLIWTQYNADSKKTYWRKSQESRIMEKKTDGWKIVNVSAFWDAKNNIPFDSLKIQ